MAEATKAKKRGRRKAEHDAASKMAKVFAHPVRTKILTMLGQKEYSPKEITEILHPDEENPPIAGVAYHFRVLAEADLIEEVKSAHRRGAKQTWYRATSRAFLGDPLFPALSPDEVEVATRRVLNAQLERIKGAIEGRTIDKRADSHLSANTGLVDEEGWAELVEIFDRGLDRYLEIVVESGQRSERKDLFPITLGITLIESDKTY